MCSVLILYSFSAPIVSVEISNHGIVSAAGADYELSCNVTGVENLNTSMTYRWTKNSGTQTSVGMNSNIVFSPLRLSDAASYSCEVTISSDYLTGSIVARNVVPREVRIQSE